MWQYEKRLQFPVNIKEPNAKLAQVILSQYGGPDGEMGASMRYLSQRYATPYREVSGLLTDIGTEELAHRCCISKRAGVIPALFCNPFTLWLYISRKSNQCQISSCPIHPSLPQ